MRPPVKKEAYFISPTLLWEQIKKARIERGLTQSNALAFLQETVPTLSVWETGKMNPPVKYCAYQRARSRIGYGSSECTAVLHLKSLPRCSGLTLGLCLLGRRKRGDRTSGHERLLNDLSGPLMAMPVTVAARVPAKTYRDTVV